MQNYIKSEDTGGHWTPDAQSWNSCNSQLSRGRWASNPFTHQPVTRHPVIVVVVVVVVATVVVVVGGPQTSLPIVQSLAAPSSSYVGKSGAIQCNNGLFGARQMFAKLTMIVFLELWELFCNKYIIHILVLSDSRIQSNVEMSIGSCSKYWANSRIAFFVGWSVSLSPSYFLGRTYLLRKWLLKCQIYSTNITSNKLQSWYQ